MKGQKYFLVLFTSLFLFAFLIPAFADEGELEALKKQIQQLQERIRVLEEKQKQAPPSVQELQEKVKTLEEKQKVPLAELRSKLGDLLAIGGDVRVNFTAAQDHPSDDAATYSTFKSNKHSRFELDKLRLKIGVKPTENIEFKSKIDFEGENDKVKVTEGYLNFKNISPFDQWLCFGLKRRIIDEHFERITASSPIARTAFWKYGDVGVQYGGEYKSIYWRASVTNGMVLDTKQIGEDNGTRDKIIIDNKGDTDNNNNKQVGLGLGYKANLGTKGALDVLGFGYLSKLSSSDITNALTTSKFPNAPTGSTGTGTTDKTQRRLGVSAVYDKDDFELAGQYFRAQDSFLRRHVWFLHATYTFDTNFKYLKAIQPLFRFDKYVVRWPHNVSYPYTWNRDRFTLALINHIRRDTLFLKIEYAWNREKTGADQPANDELLMQLQYKF